MEEVIERDYEVKEVLEKLYDEKNNCILLL